jgi:hypothetical protein
MDMDPKILLEITKIISEQNGNPIRIEKNLVQKNPAKYKTRSYTVQLGSRYLTIHRPKNSQWSEAQQQQFFDQLYQMNQNKKLFHQICEMEEPLKSGISEDALNRIRGGDLGKSGLGPRSKTNALKNPRKSGSGSLFVEGFTPHRQYCSRPINKPLSCRNNVKMEKEEFNKNQNLGGSSSSMKTNLKMTRSSLNESSKTIEIFDGKIMDTSDRSLDHLVSKHGHRFGVNDPLPMDSKQQDTNYFERKIRTRLTPENRNQFRNNLQEFGHNSDLVPFYNISIRGKKNDVYYCSETKPCITAVINPETGRRQLIKA